MDESFSIKAKKREIESEVALCIICLTKNLKENVIKQPKLNSIKKLLSITRERHRSGDPKVAEFVPRTKERTGIDIMNKKERYHRSGYRDFTTKVKKERAKNRYEDASRLSDAFLVQRKAGRPSLDKLSAQEKKGEIIVLSSQGCSFNKNLRIICQERCGRLHDVEFIATDQRMLHVAEKYDDEGAFYRRINHIRSASDAVANDVKYHLKCWAAAKQHVAILDKSYASQQVDPKPDIIADIEIINILQAEHSHPSHKVVTTNQVESKYRHLLMKHGMLEEDLHKSYKK